MYESEAVRSRVKSPVVKDAFPSFTSNITYKDPCIVFPIVDLLRKIISLSSRNIRVVCLINNRKDICNFSRLPCDSLVCNGAVLLFSYVPTAFYVA